MRMEEISCCGGTSNFKKRVVNFVENVAAMTHYVKTDLLLEALTRSVNYKMLNVKFIIKA